MASKAAGKAAIRRTAAREKFELRRDAYEDPKVGLFGPSLGDERLSAGERRVSHALDHIHREALRELALERVQADDLLLALRLGETSEHAALGDVPAKPHAPAV